MLKKILLIALLIVSGVNAQKEVAKIATEYKAKTYNKKESLSISNTDTKELVLLVEDAKETNLYVLGEDFKEKGKLSANRLEKSFKNFIGYSIAANQTYSIFFSNNNKKKFGVLSFNFTTKVVEQNILEVKHGKEKYVESITQNNKFYIITASKTSSDVHFYEYNHTGFVRKHVVPFSGIMYKKDGYTYKVISLLTKKGWLGTGGINKIDENSPTSIESASDPIKLYQLKDKILFVSDNQLEATKIIEINTNDFSSKTLSFDVPKLDLKGQQLYTSFINHNSFYKNNILYQVAICSFQMKFKVSNFETTEVLKEITVNKKDSITFKNGPIIQKGGSGIYSERVRELEKTSKFLRKASSGNLGVTSFHINGMNQIKIGNYKEIRSGAGAPGFGAFGAAGGIAFASAGAISTTFNPVGTAYYGHKSSKSTYINCLFDTDFNHLEGEKPLENVFDVIEDYENSFFNENTIITAEKKEAIVKYGEHKTIPKLKNIFYHNGHHFFGYLAKEDRQYHLVKF